ncbi:MAG: hypothetical protein AAF227_03260 [Pseudomonadota bacterium]
MSLTRRDLSKLTLGAAVAVQATPASAFLFGRGLSLENVTQRLADDLNTALKPGCDGRFEVFDNGTTDIPYWNVDVVIRLTWPPGYRQRRFTALGQKGDEAYEKVLAKATSYYRDIWPQEDGSSCLR